MYIKCILNIHTRHCKINLQPSGLVVALEDPTWEEKKNLMQDKCNSLEKLAMVAMVNTLASCILELTEL